MRHRMAKVTMAIAVDEAEAVEEDLVKEEVVGVEGTMVRPSLHRLRLLDTHHHHR